MGFVFCSPTTSRDGARVTCMKMTSSGEPPAFICRRDSRNGSDSMSPTVPPHSTIRTSSDSSAPIEDMRLFISSVTCGIIWTQAPRYLPSRSASITDEKTWAVVMLWLLGMFWLRNLS